MDMSVIAAPNAPFTFHNSVYSAVEAVFLNQSALKWLVSNIKAQFALLSPPSK